MRYGKKSVANRLLAALLWLAPACFPQESPKPPAAQTPIQVSTELVLVNVVARDRKGNPVRDLKREDFTVYEDGKKQQISAFDFEDVDQLTAGEIGRAHV